LPVADDVSQVDDDFTDVVQLLSSDQIGHRHFVASPQRAPRQIVAGLHAPD
jgi:hypothetical protein